MGRRSGEAQSAQHRKAGPMKHRNTPRGGSRNTQAEIYDEDGEPSSEYEWNGLCLAGKHGLDYEGQPCDLCEGT